MLLLAPFGDSAAVIDFKQRLFKINIKGDAAPRTPTSPFSP